MKVKQSMGCLMQHATYKGLRACILENEHLRLTFLPDYACKLASLVKKSSGREFLFQSARPTLQLPVYGAAFSAYDSSGFDEVFPSIDACPYPDGPYQNTPIPDHGELWAMKWNSVFSEDNKSVQAHVKSEFLPYIFSRTAILNKNEIDFTYTVENTSNADFKFIWTPHCLLACTPHTRLLVPENLTQVMTVEHSTRRLGPWGTLHSYPHTADVNGRPMDLSATEPPTAQNCEKFYFISPNTQGWCGAEHTDNGDVILYRYDADKIPYLGVWKTQGGYRGEYNLALEPCTGVYDDLYIANKIKKAAVIPPFEKYTWNFKIIIH